MRFAAYQSRLYGYALALCRDCELASEIVQECVIRAMTTRRVPADEPAYRAWLFTIVRNLWLDHMRKVHTRNESAVEAGEEPTSNPFAQEDAVINVIAVRQAFEQLPTHHRDILALVDVAGFGYTEAAVMLGVPQGTVMSRVSRARAALAKRLSATAAVPLRRGSQQGSR